MFEGHINVFIVVREGHKKKLFFKATGWKFLYFENFEIAVGYKSQIAVWGFLCHS
jgi:hypothetical protein